MWRRLIELRPLLKAVKVWLVVVDMELLRGLSEDRELF
jgi:hypothetical protein